MTALARSFALALTLGALPVTAAPDVAIDAPAPGPPAGFLPMEVVAVVPHDEGNTLLLVDGEAERVLPIAIGSAEALAIHLRLTGEKVSRPLTHDLLDQLVTQLGGRLEKVHIARLEDGVFHGRVFVRRGGQRLSVDARASDACALALGNQVPIFVARPVLRQAGMSARALLEGLQDETPSSTAPAPRAAPGARRAPSTVPDADGTLNL